VADALEDVIQVLPARIYEEKVDGCRMMAYKSAEIWK
jgi:hypothetical protein